MISYLLSCSIGVGILLAWIGWGGIVNAALVRRHEQDWGQRGAWGLAAVIFVGGVLEAASLVSLPVIWGLLSVGVAWVLFDVLRSPSWLRRTPRRLGAVIVAHKLASVLALIVFAAIAFRYLGFVHHSLFNIHDDFHAYLVFPSRMLESGSAGQDLLNHRRLVSGLGGKYFLDAIGLGTGSIHSQSLIDSGLGLILVAGVLLGDLRRRKAAPIAGACVMMLLLLLPPPRVNMTAIMLGTGLLLSLFRTLDDERLTRERPFSAAAVVALVAAALCSLKNSFIPPTGLVLATSYLIYLCGSGSWRRRLIEGIACAALLSLFLLPWMLSLYRASGTLLYPILGRGLDGSRYGALFETTAFQSLDQKLALLKVAVTQPMFLALAATALVALIGTGRIWRGSRGALISLLIGCGAGAIVVVFLTTATGTTLAQGANRFCFPILLAPYLSLLALAAATRATSPDSSPAGSVGARPRLRLWRGAGLTVIALLLCSAYLPDIRIVYRDEALRGIQFGLSSPPSHRSQLTTKIKARFRELQDAVPPGERILARLDLPFLLDFDRNLVLVVDHPTLASPPPGMPAYAGAEALAEYLLDQDIRFVMFSYANEANYSARLFGYRLSPDTHPSYRETAMRVFDFNESLHELGRTRHRLRDTGDIFILDLARRTGAAATPARPVRSPRRPEP